MIAKQWPVLCLCAAVGTAQTLSAQGNRGLRRTRTTVSADSAQRWALLIAVGRYEDKPGISDLNYAVSDCLALREMLVAGCGFSADNVCCMVDDAPETRQRPTRNNIIAQLSAFLALPGSGDIVLFYFAGHGIEADKTTYLLPSDAKMANLQLTGLRLSHIKDELRACKAQKKVVILDACHSGAGRNVLSMGDAFSHELEESRGLVTLASCDLGQVSYEWEEVGHGAFTYFLLRGLSGNADRDFDGRVTASELNVFVYEQTRRWASSRQLVQTPKFVADVSGDILLSTAAHGGIGTSTGLPVIPKDPGPEWSTPQGIWKRAGSIAVAVVLVVVIASVIAAIAGRTKTTHTTQEENRPASQSVLLAFPDRVSCSPGLDTHRIGLMLKPEIRRAFRSVFKSLVEDSSLRGTARVEVKAEVHEIPATDMFGQPITVNDDGGEQIGVPKVFLTATVFSRDGQPVFTADASAEPKWWRWNPFRASAKMLAKELRRVPEMLKE